MRKLSVKRHTQFFYAKVKMSTHAINVIYYMTARFLQYLAEFVWQHTDIAKNLHVYICGGSHIYPIRCNSKAITHPVIALKTHTHTNAKHNIVLKSIAQPYIREHSIAQHNTA